MERHYPILSQECYGFFAGVTADRKQVLMGLLCPDLVALFFDSDGNLLSTERRSVEFFQGVAPPYNIHDQRIPGLIRQWQAELGFESTTIQVKRFFSDQLLVGIDDYPSHFEEILADPSESEEEKESIRMEMTEWDELGQFVLVWGNDYWLDSTGDVTSS